jgi:hypothetical protein
MKIDYAVMSSDDSHYLDYWPVVSEAWRRIGVEPILFSVGPWLKDGTTVRLPLVSGVKPSIQGKLARLWAFKVLAGNCITSDIDMMPLSRQYFAGNAAPYRENQIVSYCSDAAELFDKYHPMCYVLANSKVMGSLIEQTTWEEFVLEIAKRGGQESGNQDQWWVTRLLDSYDKVVKLKRGWSSAGEALNRLDRNRWEYKPEDVGVTLYDAHLPRPYAEHQEEIKKLLALVK